MPVLIRNPLAQDESMPAPYRGILKQGQSCMLNLTADDFYTSIGGRDNAGTLSVTDKPMYTGDFDTARMPGGDATFTDLQVTGDLLVAGETTLSDAVHAEDDVDVDGDGTIGGTLGVTGATTLSSTLAVTGTTQHTGAVGIGAAPVASTALSITSTTLAFMLPRMTTTQRDAIATPAAGMLIYNTTTNKLNVRVAAAWEEVTSA